MSREVSTGAILEVVFQGFSDGQVTLSVFHYRLNNAIADSDGTNLVTALEPLINAVGELLDKYLDCCSQDFLMNDITMQWIYPTRYSAQHFAPFALAGNVAQPKMPSNVAAALLKRTFLTGRRQRGVLHMPGVPTTFVVDSEFTAPAIATYDALGDHIDNVLILATNEQFEPVIFNKAFPVTSPQIQSVDAESTVRIMRRRTVGVGQ